MTGNFFRLSPAKDIFVYLFHQATKDGPPTLRDEYASFRCRGCGKIDEASALAQGVSESFVVPRRAPDAFVCAESKTIVSARSRRLLESIRGIDVSFFPVPSAADYFVMFPNQIITPPVDSRVTKRGSDLGRDGEAFRFTGPPCKKCQRAPESAWRARYVEAPANLVLAAAMLEGAMGSKMAWMASAPFVEEFKKKKIPGWSITKP